MKKSLVALAALAVAGVASAQSSVTLFGVVDASISSVTNKSELVTNPLTLLANPLYYVNVPGSIRTSRTGLNNSAYNSSRLGFRGVEDLGGGLAASFWLEGALSNDDGTPGGLNFQRRSTVSLSGGFGEVRLGRDYKPTFWNYTIFDPFGTNGVGTSVLQKAGSLIEASNVRQNNSIGYFLPPNLGGFYGQVQYGFHEQLKAGNGLQGAFNQNSRGGRYWGGRFGYANGPLDVAVAYGQGNQGSNWATGIDDIAKNFNIGASYDFGVVKLFGQIGRVKEDLEYSSNTPVFNPSNRLDAYLIGVTVPVGAGQIRASYSRARIKTDVDPTEFLINPYYSYAAPKADQFAVGYVHNLSKRTALYATVAYVKNKNGMNLSAGSGNITASWASTFTGVDGVVGSYVPKTSLGYDLGIRHAF